MPSTPPEHDGRSARVIRRSKPLDRRRSTYALNDSPAGLLAWDLDRFVDYDPTTSAQTPIGWDAILTDVTITWLTGTAGSSARLYKDATDAFAAGDNSGVPTAVANFTGDQAVSSLVERSHTIVRWTDYDTGGHFASLQVPKLLAADIWEFAEMRWSTTRTDAS